MSGRPRIERLRSTADLLTVEWANGERSEFAGIWLRDNLREDRDPHSGQRRNDVVDLPAEPRIKSARLAEDEIRIEWEGDAAPASFALEWLARHGSASARRPEQRIATWLAGGGMNAARDFAWSSIAQLQREPAARLDWLTHLLQSGIAFSSSLPPTDEAILDAVAPLGSVCDTNYGRVFDVRSVPQPENLAYSDLGLGLHTDNPYREPVPGFQMLHVLIASPDGGESLFGDGFAIAEHLRSTDREAFAVLTQTAVPFLYRSKDAELYAERPLIQLSCDGEVTAVHYNSRSIAPLQRDARECERFYRAYRRFASLLRDPRFQLRFMLRDGDLAVFDNQRILHGRTAFSSSRFARHLRGCYLTRDSVYSQAALLRREFPVDEPS